MKDKIEVLDRYFNSFIDEANEYHFFLGLYDYLKYVDTVPEIEKVIAKLPAIRQEKDAEIKTIEKAVIEDLIALRDKLKKIVDSTDLSPLKRQDQKEIQLADFGQDHESIDREFVEFDAFVEGKILGSSPIPVNLALHLEKIIQYLVGTKAKSKIGKYLAYHHRNKDQIVGYKLSKKFDDYTRRREIYEDRLETELWGKFNDLSVLYFAMTTAREQFSNLMKEANAGKEKDHKKLMEALNLAPLSGEWKDVRTQNDRKFKVNFKKDETKIIVKRLHNYIVEQCLARTDQIEPAPSAESITDTITVPEKSILTNPTLGVMDYRKSIYGYIQLFPRTKRVPIGKPDTRLCRLIRSLFSPENRESNVVYNPVFQGIDRVFENISLPKDKLDGGSTDYTGHDKVRIIETTIKEAQKIKELQGYIHFEWMQNKQKLRLLIHPKEG